MSARLKTVLVGVTVTLALVVLGFILDLSGVHSPTAMIPAIISVAVTLGALLISKKYPR